jgi:ferredoxin
MSGFEVTVDRDECVSAGKCVASVPGYFMFDDDELAMIDPDGPKPDDGTLLRVARACPSMAIHLFRDGDELEL